MPIETFKEKKKRARKIVSLLKRYYSTADCALHYRNSLELLIAVILSAQCSDQRVNQVTQLLFKKYPNVKAFAECDLKDLEKTIYATGFFRVKARNIQLACQKIQKNFNGKVPKSLSDLLTLPGVGRKTALVVLGTGFQMSLGVVVDTHVRRLSYRLWLTQFKDPVKIEQDLCRLLPRSNWIYFSHALIFHGRQICKARIPRCHTCFLDEFCPKKGVA